MNRTNVRFVRISFGFLALSVAGLHCDGTGRPRETQTRVRQIESPAQGSLEPTEDTTEYFRLDDVEGFYVPNEEIIVGLYRITALSLDLGASLVVATEPTGHVEGAPDCPQRTASKDTLHVVCRYAGLGDVTIDGRFLVPRSDSGITLSKSQDPGSTDVLSAVVTVTKDGLVLHSKRHAFRFRYGE